MKKQMTSLTTSRLYALLLALFTLPSAPLQAALLGTLPDKPLYLSGSVEPNVMFLLDDSGSMEWETLVQGDTDGILYIAGLNRHYILPTKNNGKDKDWQFPACIPYCYYPYTAPSATLEPDSKRLRNHNYNTLYYNPAVVYTPWSGEDTSVPYPYPPLYSNADPAAAPVDPTLPAGDTLDLTTAIAFTLWAPPYGVCSNPIYLNSTDCWDNGGFWDSWVADSVFPAHYYKWTDTDTNGIVDTTDAFTLEEIKPENAPFDYVASRTDCTNSINCSYLQEIQNFANWFTYYRKRAYVAKQALGNIINDSDDSRMGTWAYNAGLVRNAEPMSNATSKLNLLQDTYGQSIFCNGWAAADCPLTPARTALQSLGKLFAGVLADPSPILPVADGGECQKNFDIIITDGYWDGATSPAIGNADGDNGSPYADSYSDTLADVAMYYYETDLSTGAGGLANKVSHSPLSLDQAPHQHLVTSTIGLGVTGSLTPLAPTADHSGVIWTDPYGVSANKIDDLWHAAVNGRGTYTSAADTQTLNSALIFNMNDVKEATSTAAAVAFNSTKLDTGSTLYLARFNTTYWRGDLLSINLNGESGALTTTNWNAADTLKNETDRTTVITYKNDAVPPEGIKFETLADLSADQQADLKSNLPAESPALVTYGSIDLAAEARLNFIRGVRSNEDDVVFRARDPDTILGDIVHANPVFVGKPIMPYPDSTDFHSVTAPYSIFKDAQSARTGVIYAAANDGVLHGFKESDGTEVLAYIPGMHASTTSDKGLHYLSDPSYTHRYYNDLSPTVSDVFMLNTNKWATVLIGGLRGGGRGLYALDVTNPDFASRTPADIVMWEYTNANNPNLGHTFSQPIMVKTQDGWYAVVGNGYNQTGTNGKAKLLMLSIEGGMDGDWTDTGDVYEIATGAADTGSIVNNDCLDPDSNCNGLSTPDAVDSDGDGMADTVYAGDLLGNLWAFDLTTSPPSLKYTKPLFQTQANQRITVKPVAAAHPTESSGVIVYFGTGSYLTDSDKGNFDGQSFYAVWDNDPAVSKLPYTIANLVKQTISTVSGERTIAGDIDVAYNSKSGWYVDLPDTGERVAANPKVRGKYVFFNTLIPETGVCDNGGSGWLMALQLGNGKKADADRPVFDTNGDNKVDDNDLIGGTDAASGIAFTDGIAAESNFLGDKMYTPGSSGNVSITAIDDGGTPTGRLSWREIRQ